MWLERLQQVSLVRFLIFWLILNLVQAYFTEVHNDESYYWLYSNKLAWGYYDHPPMVAIFIKLGSFLLEGPLGIRIFNLLALVSATGIILSLLEQRIRPFAYLILFSMPFLNYLHFVVFPDGPLLLFFAIFLRAYKSFTLDQSWKMIVVMGVALGAMLYSKYHAVLVLPLIALTDLSQLKRGWMYGVGLIALVLFLPHLTWQYSEGFPSIQFHLQGRSQPFKLEYTFTFISQQLLAVGPVILLAIYHRPKEVFERTLKMLVIGVYFFFLLASSRGFVHMQWTSLAFFPALVLGAQVLDKLKVRAVALSFLLLAVGVTIALRAQLIYPVWANKIGPHFVHGQKDWAQEMSSLAGDRVLISENDIKTPSMYSFYTGKEAIAFYPGYPKRSQYDLWQVEDSFQGKPALLLKKFVFPKAKSLAIEGRTYHYHEIDKFISYQNIKVEILEATKVSDGIEIRLKIRNHRTTSLAFQDSVRFLIRDQVKRADRDTYLQALTRISTIGPMETVELTFKSEKPLRGRYAFGIDDGLLSPSINSDFVNIGVTP